MSNSKYRVSCECARWIPVIENQMGRAITCSCGRRVEVPLLDEFLVKPDLLSNTTIDRRLARMIQDGALPPAEHCAACETSSGLQIVQFEANCEWMTNNENSNNFTNAVIFLFIFLIFLPVGHIMLSFGSATGEVEILGRDTVHNLPLCLCHNCINNYSSLSSRWYWVGGLLLLFIAVLLCMINLYVAIATGSISIWFILIARAWAYRSRQRFLKTILSQVPIYRQLLKVYPGAIIAILPPKSVSPEEYFDNSHPMM
jgi:hypothetical protein